MKARGNLGQGELAATITSRSTRIDTADAATYFSASNGASPTRSTDGSSRSGRESGMQASGGTGVPLCDLQTQQMALRPDIDKAVSRVLASGQFILGPEVRAFEEEVAAYCGAGYGVGCASGTDALLLALHALDIGPGDEVIMPPFTFFATAGSVSRTGARPVFADIDAQTFNLD